MMSVDQIHHSPLIVKGKISACNQELKEHSMRLSEEEKTKKQFSLIIRPTATDWLNKEYSIDLIGLIDLIV